MIDEYYLQFSISSVDITIMKQVDEQVMDIFFTLQIVKTKVWTF